MYVVTNHNEANTILLGPIEWNSRFISAVLTDDLEQQITIYNTDKDRVPFDVIPGVTLRVCNTEYEPIDPIIDRHEGPFWTYNDNGTATATWIRQDKDLTLSKNEVLQKLAYIRWTKEELGTNTVVQNTTVTVDTRRESRDIFIQKLTLMQDNETVVWKFPEGWLTLTKPDLANVVSAGASYVQSQFEWEANLSNIVMNVTTRQDLANVYYTDIDPPQPSPQII